MRRLLRILAVVLHVTSMQAQRPIVLKEPAGQLRSIRLAPLARLKGDENLGLPYAIHVAVLNNKLLYVGPAALRKDNFGLFIFDTSGKMLKRLGQEGDGPGEFRGFDAIAVGPGDSIYVLDRNRITVIAGDKIVRTFQVRSASFSGMQVLKTGERVMSCMTGVNRAFETFNTAGRSVYSAPRVPGAPNWLETSVVGTGLGSVITAKQYEYRLNLWSADGKPGPTFVRSVEWFGKWPPKANPDSDRVATLAAVWEDATGLVWTAVRVPSKSWSRPTPKRGRKATDFDTIVEVLDLGKGTVVATQRFLGMGWGDAVAPPGLRITTSEDEDGFQFFQLSKLELQ